MRSALIILLLAFGVSATSARAQEPACDPAAVARPDAVQAVEPTVAVPGVKTFVVSCGALTATAVVRDSRSISLSMMAAGGRPVFGPTTPDAFMFYAPLVARALSDRPDTQNWQLSVRGYPAFGARLSAAAAKDGGWSGPHGRPRQGSVNAYVVALANRARIFEEVEGLARGNGFHARVASVENVELCSPAGHGKEHVPCGGLVWFELHR